MVLWKNSCSPNLEKLFFSWREYFLTKKAKKNFIYDIGDIKGNSQHLWINITNKEGFECKKRTKKKENCYLSQRRHQENLFLAKEFMVSKVLCTCIHNIQVKVPQNQRDKALPKPIFQALYQNCRAGNK